MLYSQTAAFYFGEGMINRKTFFDLCRDKFFHEHISTRQFAGLEAILDYWELHYSDIRWLAYILATGFRETDAAFAPIEEYGKGRGKSYPPYYGRGLVQLTWAKNYQTMSEVFGVDLVKHPEKALDLDLSVKILFYGMTHGTFGGKLSTYIHGQHCDYVGARHCVNGTDKAELIAGYARSFEKVLTASDEKEITPENIAQKFDEISTDPPPSILSEPPAVNSAGSSVENAAPSSAQNDAGAANQTAQDISIPVPQITPESEPEKEVTGIKASWGAAVTFFTTTGAGIVTALTSSNWHIVAVLAASAGIVGIVFVIARFIYADREKQRANGLRMKREAQAHELQLLTVQSAANKNLNTVHIVSSNIENSDTTNQEKPQE